MANGWTFGAGSLGAGAAAFVATATTAPTLFSTVNQASSTLSGQTSGAAMEQKLVELSIAASEARTDTKFAQLIGKIDLLASNVADLKTVTERVEGKTDNTKLTIIVSVIGTGIALAALFYAAIQIFQSGMGVSASAYSAGMAAAEARKNDHAQAGSEAGQTGAVRSGAADGNQTGVR